MATFVTGFQVEYEALVTESPNSSIFLPFNFA